MYIPSFFEEHRPEAIASLIDDYAFAILLTLPTEPDTPPWVSHLPLLYDVSERTLHGHMARANPHWRAFQSRVSLAIFQGPHGYISPAWYPPRPDNVPTWNYAVVHAYGRPRLVEEPERAWASMRKLVERNEQLSGTGWKLEENGVLEKKMSAIVVFAMPVERFEAKFKLSQQQAPAVRAEVARALSESDAPSQRELGRWMR